MNSSVSLFPLLAFIPFIIYIGLLIFGVWFAVSLIKILKEKNQILKEIARILENGSKEEI
ncbi:hypothetical protein [Parageobacillus thermoglucosidasius]|uniref:CcmD family protein n=2 Tax=Parageobacillus thermoglucosidasius TaxID=1426 RepID=A0AB38QZU8_PARTM|nr:hypothetical protein [Parageobacillus thermoglucosidasius]KYD12967.1 hypothetical protein B4168_2851 [Anoxybacillus flavithermus]REK57597.1 MAG: hypothetical protein C6P36_05855 [Geobacillus sp.]AEH49197.1 hypothetical protein Geoth_3333 [Parageobacillus thermoglucosidasius C56-YS93]ALF09610.1 hypothetical protein AOT13_06170 [Parageobacillus thermoglucosidasius]ANZ29693.1 hypothetical protein BCV53_06180 [Parageobacillus thermoglucosidasius]